MRLKTNQNHFKGSFAKRKNNFWVRVGAIVLTCSLYGGILGGVLSYLSNLERVVMVSQDTRESMYRDNWYFNSDDYDALQDTDLGVTTKALDDMYTLNLDARKTIDFSFLAHCTHLKVLFISNAQDLTDDALETISSYSDLKVHLTFSISAISKCKQSIHLSLLKGMNVTLHSDAVRDLDEYLFYVYLKRQNHSFVTSIDVEKYEKIDEKINALLGKIDFNDAFNETDVLLKLIAFVGNYIEYDSVVSANLDYEKGSVEDVLVHDYNREAISFILNSDEREVSGICCNYVALLSALCYKMGIESYYVAGSRADGSRRHAWNLVGVDGNYYFVDVTRIDNNDVLKDYMAHVRHINWLKSNTTNVPIEKYQASVINNFEVNTLYSVDDELYGRYVITTDVDALMQDDPSLEAVSYVNQDRDGVLVNLKGIDASYIWSFACLGGSLGLLFNDEIVDRQAAKRILKKNDNEEMEI